MVEILWEVDRIKFEDDYFLASSNPEAILSKLYGNYIKLPQSKKDNGMQKK